MKNRIFYYNLFSFVSYFIISYFTSYYFLIFLNGRREKNKNYIFHIYYYVIGISFCILMLYFFMKMRKNYSRQKFKGRSIG